MSPKSLGTFEKRDWFVRVDYFRSTQRTKWNQGKTKAKQIALYTRCMTVLQPLTDHLRKKMKTTEWKRQRWWRKWNGWEAWKEGKLLSAGHWQLLVKLRLFFRFYCGQWILMKTGFSDQSVYGWVQGGDIPSMEHRVPFVYHLALLYKTGQKTGPA